MRILAEDTLALIIDFQERLVPVMHHGEEIIHNTEILVKGLRTLGIPMLVTQQYTKGIGMTIPSIQAAAGENFTYYDKVSFSCADNQDIMQIIEESGKRNILICGIEAHICVLQTVIDLLAKGYHVILAEDCCSSRKENDRRIGMMRAKEEGAALTTYESILFELMRTAKAEKFKEISALIK